MANLNTWCVDDQYGVCVDRDFTEADAKAFAQQRANRNDETYYAYDASVPHTGLGDSFVFKKQSNTEFAVGDGVSWGFNGDCDAGTVERVTRSRVYVRRDRVTFVRPVEYGEQPECTFSPDPEGDLEVFTFRAPAAYRRMGNKSGWTLGHGRHWSRNPSF